MTQKLEMAGINYGEKTVRFLVAKTELTECKYDKNKVVLVLSAIELHELITELEILI